MSEEKSEVREEHKVKKDEKGNVIEEESEVEVKKEED